MDIAGVNLIFGDQIPAGHSQFIWNADGSLQRKRVYADASYNHLIYTKDFTWNPDGTLNQWVLTIATTGETVTKNFGWASNGFLVNTDVGSTGVCL